MSDNLQQQLGEAIQSARGRSEVHQAVLTIYDEVARAVKLRKPVCLASGRCCHFDEFGHRLYVTTLELAVFVDQLTQLRDQLQPDCPGTTETAQRQKSLQLPMIDASAGSGCRFQVNGLCSVHAIRPFGCRMFYCDPTAQTWQMEQYEHFHTRIKQEHERLGVPYLYVEWRHALRIALDQPPVSVSPQAD